MLAKSARKFGLLIQATVLVFAGTLSILGSSASAVTTQLSNRSVASLTSVPGVTNTLTFTFETTDKGTTADVKQIEIEFCDTPLGACSAVTNTPTLPAVPSASLGGGWAGVGVTTTRENGRTDAAVNKQIKIVITTPADENDKAALTIQIGNITNNGTANRSYYPRLRLYSDTGTTLEWYGSVAQSTSQTLTVNARVQEILQFCVGSTAVNDATTAVAADCSAVTGTSVDLGVVNSSAVNTTPVALATGGDMNNAIAMVQTNAVNGVNIAYKAIQDTSSGKLKVVGATCSGTTVTDQCFNSQGTVQGTFTAGTENFGMTVGGINCSSVPGTAYTCVYADGCSNLQPQTNYVGGAYTYDSTVDCTGAGSGTFGAASGFAWDDTGTARTIASSASSTTKVVANEALIIKFAATAGITTPTGQYQTQADFIATPTY